MFCKERDLFRAMLSANSARLEHTPLVTTKGNPWCLESFIQLRYPLQREVTGNSSLLLYLRNWLALACYFGYNFNLNFNNLNFYSFIVIVNVYICFF